MCAHVSVRACISVCWACMYLAIWARTLHATHRSAEQTRRPREAAVRSHCLRSHTHTTECIASHPAELFDGPGTNTHTHTHAHTRARARALSGPCRASRCTSQARMCASAAYRLQPAERTWDCEERAATSVGDADGCDQACTAVPHRPGLHRNAPPILIPLSTPEYPVRPEYPMSTVRMPLLPQGSNRSARCHRPRLPPHPTQAVRDRPPVRRAQPTGRAGASVRVHVHGVCCDAPTLRCAWHVLRLRAAFAQQSNSTNAVNPHGRSRRWCHRHPAVCS
jgi:hypothetical protein